MAKVTVNYNQGELTHVIDGVNNRFIFKIELYAGVKLVFGKVIFNPGKPKLCWEQINRNSIDRNKIESFLFVGSELSTTGHMIEIKDNYWNDSPNFAIAVKQNDTIEIVFDQNRLERPIKTLILR